LTWCTPTEGINHGNLQLGIIESKLKSPFYFSLIECGVHPFKLRFFQARVSETLSTGLGALFILFVHQMTALGMSLWWGKLQTSPAIAINYKSLAGLVGKCG